MSAKISVSLYQTHISNHIFLRELSKHKLRLLELWRTTIRDVKVSLGNTSKVSGVFFVTSNYICYTIYASQFACTACMLNLLLTQNTMSYTLNINKNSPVDNYY